jgi:hypothetical protein
MPRKPRIKNTDGQSVTALPFEFKYASSPFVRIRGGAHHFMTLSIEDADRLAGDILAITQPLIFSKNLKGI